MLFKIKTSVINKKTTAKYDFSIGVFAKYVFSIGVFTKKSIKARFIKSVTLHLQYTLNLINLLLIFFIVILNFSMT